MDKALKRQKIIGWIVIGVILALTIAAIVGNIVNYGFSFASIINLFPAVMICGILCLITYMSAIKNSFAAAAKAQNEAVFEFNKKGFLIGLLLLVVCAAASSPLWIFGFKRN